ncbi:hypothetical protein K2X85_08395 [bacterium]|nr:hypothetical protein [bacterium]
MAYQFPPDVEELVRKQMQSGEFASEDDLIREALRTLDRTRDDLAAIESGLADVDAGRVRPFEEFDREFRARNGISDDDQRDA